MTKYCDVHGAVEASNDQTICGILFGGNAMCRTFLKPTPEELVKRAMATPQVGQVQPNSTPNTRDEEGKAMRQGAFLAAYGKTGRLSKAAAIAEVDRTTHYNWLKDPEYSRAFENAKRLAFHTLADEAWRRAMGEDCAQASDRLMIKLLESLGPGAGHPEYGPAVKHEHSTAPGRPMEVNVSASEQLHSRIASLVAGSTEAKTS